MTDVPTIATGPGDRPLEVIYKPVESLTPDPRNARTHPKGLVRANRLEPAGGGP